MDELVAPCEVSPKVLSDRDDTHQDSSGTVGKKGLTVDIPAPTSQRTKRQNRPNVSPKNEP